MIQKNDLRIGNTILFNLQYVNVDELLQDQIFFSWPGMPFGKMGYDFANPIPLTEDLILQLGTVDEKGLWKPEAKYYERGYLLEVKRFFLHQEGTSMPWVLRVYTGKASYTISLGTVPFLHKLQNLFFVLTGRELIFKLRS